MPVTHLEGSLQGPRQLPVDCREADQDPCIAFLDREMLRHSRPPHDLQRQNSLEATVCYVTLRIVPIARVHSVQAVENQMEYE